MWDYKSTDDFDDDWQEPLVRRTCFGCFGPVLVSIEEPYQVQVWCERCLEKSRERIQATVGIATKTGAA